MALRFIVIGLVLILNVTLTNAATVYIINVPQDGVASDSLDEKIFLDTLINNFRNIKRELKLRNKCDGRFGSIYGTGVQKLRCLNRKVRSPKEMSIKKLFKTRLRYPARKLYNIKQQDRDYALDYLDVELTRSRPVLRKPDFSNDYLDVNDLRTLRTIPFDYIDINVDLNLNIDRSTPKTRRSGHVNRASSDSSDSEYEDTFKGKPKRFKIIPSDSAKHTDSSVSDSSDDISDKKQISTETADTDSERKVSSSDSTDTDSSEVVDKKLRYMQNLNRITGDDGRKRIQHFLPKRFHWSEDEFDELGYFWFSGHRGKYAEPWRIDVH